MMAVEELSEEALIPCEGECPEPTRHVYTFRRVAEVGPSLGWHRMFECTVCNISRVFGCLTIPKNVN